MYDYYAEYDAWRQARLEGRIPEDLLYGEPVDELDELHKKPLDTRIEWARTLEQIETLPETGA